MENLKGLEQGRKIFMIKDMTKGDPLGLIMWFSVPLLIGNIFQQLYNIADIAIVGRTLGVNALAAVGAISPIFFFLMMVKKGEED